MRKFMRIILQLTVSIMMGMLILGIQFYVSSSKEQFIGTLSDMESFAIVDTHISSQWSHQLLRFIHRDERVSYALYADATDAVFEFYDTHGATAGLWVVTNPHSDYVIIDLTSESLEVLRMDVILQGVKVDTFHFVHVSEIVDARLLDHHDQDASRLLISDAIIQEVNLIQYLESRLLYLAGIIGGLTLFFNILFLMIRQFKIRSLHLSDSSLLAFDRIRILAKKIVWLLQQLFFNVFGGIFLFVLTALALVLIFGEDPSAEESPNEAVYFETSGNGFNITVNIGLSDSSWNDSDYGPHYVYYEIIFNAQPSGYYIASFLTEEGFKGSALSDQGMIATGYVDENLSRIPIYFASDFETSETFRLVIRNAYTGMIVFTSEPYELYKDSDLVKTSFNVSIGSEPWRYSWYIFLFHVLVTTTLIRYLYWKGEDKRILRREKRRQLSDSQEYLDRKK